MDGPVISLAEMLSFRRYAVDSPGCASHADAGCQVFLPLPRTLRIESRGQAHTARGGRRCIPSTSCIREETPPTRLSRNLSPQSAVQRAQSPVAAASTTREGKGADEAAPVKRESQTATLLETPEKVVRLGSCAKICVPCSSAKHEVMDVGAAQSFAKPSMSVSFLRADAQEFVPRQAAAPTVASAADATSMQGPMYGAADSQAVHGAGDFRVGHIPPVAASTQPSATASYSSTEEAWLFSVASQFLERNSTALRMPAYLPALQFVPVQVVAAAAVGEQAAAKTLDGSEPADPTVESDAKVEQRPAAKEPQEVCGIEAQRLPDHHVQRLAAALSGLLDKLFDPASLQHDRRLVTHLESSCRLRQDKAYNPRGPWTPAALRSFEISTEALAALPDRRVAALLQELTGAHGKEDGRGWRPPTPAATAAALAHLGTQLRSRHLCWEPPSSRCHKGTANSRGYWRLRDPPEVRRTVEAASSAAGAGNRCGASLTVLSLSVTAPHSDICAEGMPSSTHLVRQLLAHDADVLCLQGLDCGSTTSRTGAPPTAGMKAAGQYLLTMLAAAEYKRVVAQANMIFWKAREWSLIGEHKVSAGVCVDLRSKREASAIVRVASIQPELTDCYGCSLGNLVAPRRRRGSAKSTKPLVVGADLALLGGAEGAALVPELSGLRSAMVEVVGEELCSFQPLPPTPDDVSGTGRDGDRATGRALWRPGAVLYTGSAPISVLSGHTEEYLASMTDEDIARQFPTGGPPVVATFAIPLPQP